MNYLKPISTPCRLNFFNSQRAARSLVLFRIRSCFAFASMATFVSLSFSVPHLILKEMPMPPRKLAKVTAVSNRAITGTASKCVLSCCSNKSISKNWENCHPLRVTSRPFCGIVSFSSKNIVIAGYWVGPDVDDGWGYIEAFIDRIT